MKTAVPVRPLGTSRQPGDLKSHELRAARRWGVKVGDLEQLGPDLRKVAGYQDDGTKSYLEVPDGMDPQILESRLDRLISEAEVGAKQAEAKQLQRDQQAMYRSR